MKDKEQILFDRLKKAEIKIMTLEGILFQKIRTEQKCETCGCHPKNIDEWVNIGDYDECFDCSEAAYWEEMGKDE